MVTIHRASWWRTQSVRTQVCRPQHTQCSSGCLGGGVALDLVSVTCCILDLRPRVLGNSSPADASTRACTHRVRLNKSLRPNRECLDNQDVAKPIFLRTRLQALLSLAWLPIGQDLSLAFYRNVILRPSELGDGRDRPARASESLGCQS